LRAAPGAVVLLCLAAAAASQTPPPTPLLRPDEVHLRNLRQLTFGGENAEAYWSPDGEHLIYQHSGDDVPCDQQFVLHVASGRARRVSNGQGRTTCGYFLDRGRRVLYASTHLASPECPPRPDFSQGYVWAMHAGFDLFTARSDGSGLRRLTDSPGYDAEATVSPDGRSIVFTSQRDGDLELYTMDVEGRGVQRLTHEPGYDGGAFFSPDGQRIVWRRDAPADEAALARYRERLERGLYAPGTLEIWVMNRDGSDKRRVTRLGAASFAPYFHPDGRRIVFSSNHPEPKGRNFDLYLVGDDGSALTRITSDPSFDGFPMFSPDGRRLVFASNRGARARGETNLFVADWLEELPSPPPAAFRGDVLHRLTLLRAAPGRLLELVAAVMGSAPWIFRHSQGDHWDLMLLEPVRGYAEHIGKAGAGAPPVPEELVAWREEEFVRGPELATLPGFSGGGLYHVEMFHALAGKRGSLLEQREMENAFLRGTGQPQNAIFVRELGASWDAFTIGAYRDWRHYGEAQGVAPDSAEAAAKAAGFPGRAHIGPYLRSLIQDHHDTLAVPLR
jgi:Tol biopolymer transport system component